MEETGQIRQAFTFQQRIRGKRSKYLRSHVTRCSHVTPCNMTFHQLLTCCSTNVKVDFKIRVWCDDKKKALYKNMERLYHIMGNSAEPLPNDVLKYSF